MTTRREQSSGSLAPPGRIDRAIEFPIVGIGASAGGLSAFESFFSGFREAADPGAAFVVVQHLAPDHKSMLTELIQRYTAMQVFEAVNGMTVQRNCVYVIPPNHSLTLSNGALQVDVSMLRTHRMPIDHFFESLADTQREQSVGIVLSGTGSDGTLGAQAIKRVGGVVLAQSPASAEHDGMPRSAIVAGAVDRVLAPADMPALLREGFTAGFDRLRSDSALPATSDQDMLPVHAALRLRTGHDFSQYKPSTVLRRTTRRMALRHAATIDEYALMLKQDVEEVDALFRDLLIGVTSFFRDREAFEALEHQALPRIFARKRDGDSVRVWSAGCSTGEEAYSIAMLLIEKCEAMHGTVSVQLFATDLDREAIAVARAGVYPAAVAKDVTPERLARFFVAESDGTAYRIHKRVRDMLVFSEQDVIKDPPFSRLDLICCRNLMIYMGAPLQQKLLPLFHYALAPSGVLFLGSSETVGELDDLFSPIDRQAKLYQRRDVTASGRRISFGRFLPPLTNAGPMHIPSVGRAHAPARRSLKDVTEQALLAHFGAPGALVDDKGDILYVHGRTGMYLEPVSGDVVINNVLKMAREGLRRPLTQALRKSVADHAVTHVPTVRVKTNGHFAVIQLTVRPVTLATPNASDSVVYLVVFEDQPVTEPATELSARRAHSGHATDADQSRVDDLLLELEAKDEFLQSVTEDLVTSAAELRAANDELQSVNEEFQSTNEELETSKEELQSVNEELTTVNAELQVKVAELSRSNNDMNNLLSGTGIGSVFVDHHLRILRYTPAARSIINLIPGDVGRPVGHIVSNLVGYDQLVPDIEGVLATLVPREIEVKTNNARWFTMRILPYRTLENLVEGAVINFVDITEIERTRSAMRRLGVVLRDSHDAVTVHDLEGHITAWNPGAARIYGWTEDEALAMNVDELIPIGLRREALNMVRELSQAKVQKPYHTQRITKGGALLDVSVVSTALVNEAGHVYAIATTERAMPSQLEADVAT